MKAFSSRLYPFVFLLAILVMSGCGSGRKSTEPELTQNFEHLYKWGKIYWDQRSSEDKALLATSFLEKAATLETKNYELSALLSRAWHFQGEYIETETSIKDSAFRKGMEAACNAMLVNLDTIINFDGCIDPENMLEILPYLSYDETGALYWWTVNFGKLMIRKPVLERLKYQEIYETVLYKLTSLNPNYFYGGPYRILGVFYARIPGSDLDLSKTNFDLSIQIFPKYFATKVLMAEFYYVKIGDRERFHSVLEEVINDDPTMLPAAMAENLNEQKKARALLEMESSLFE